VEGEEPLVGLRVSRYNRGSGQGKKKWSSFTLEAVVAAGGVHIVRAGVGGGEEGAEGGWDLLVDGLPRGGGAEQEGGEVEGGVGAHLGGVVGAHLTPRAGAELTNTVLVLGNGNPAMVRYVEIIVELACKAGGGGGDIVRVESRLVRFASTSAPDEEDGDAGGEDDEAEHGHDHRHQVEVRVAH